MNILVTGSAGFIGFSLARRLLEQGHSVTGFDAMTPYYDVALKRARHDILKRSPLFAERIGTLEDMQALRAAADGAPDVVLHLAAQAGVRYSLEQPRAYLDANLVGAFNMLELVRELKPRHFMPASTSSVYGSNSRYPFVETERADHPLTLYAATKKAMEDMAHSYAHLWKIPTTVFRFFTVYGPWGRPDMAPMKFVRAAIAGEPIEVYGYGRMQRDFTYIDDLAEAVIRLIDMPPQEGRPVGAPDSLAPQAPYRVVNIGGGQPVELMDFIDAVEKSVGVPIRKTFAPFQKGDVAATFASADLLAALTGFRPATPVAAGVERLVAWVRDYDGAGVAAGRS